MLTEPSIVSHDLTLWGMYLAADWVVKTVMITLVLASVATWTVFIAKSWQLRQARKRLCLAVPILTEAKQLETTEEIPGNLAVSWLNSAHTELKLSHSVFNKDGIKERLVLRLQRLEQAQMRHWRSGTGMLASIGAVTPFIGLFGTVWGIMNSFINISQANSTHLAVVAPGIAEALLATALGLVAAIPAVLIHNYCSQVLMVLRGLLGDLSAAILLLVSRDLDRISAQHSD